MKKTLFVLLGVVGVTLFANGMPRRNITMTIDTFDEIRLYKDFMPEEHITRLMHTAKTSGVDRVLWRLAGLGTAGYPSKVLTLDKEGALARTLAKYDPVAVAKKAAKKEGVAFYLWVDLIDQQNGRFTKEHPECLIRNAAGETWPGIRDFANPKAVADKLAEIDEALAYKPDGLYLSWSCHSCHFKELREMKNFGTLKGAHLTDFLRALRQNAKKVGAKILMGTPFSDKVNLCAPYMSDNCKYSIELEWKRWIDDGLVDGLVLGDYEWTWDGVPNWNLKGLSPAREKCVPGKEPADVFGGAYVAYARGRVETLLFSSWLSAYAQHHQGASAKDLPGAMKMRAETVLKTGATGMVLHEAHTFETYDGFGTIIEMRAAFDKTPFGESPLNGGVVIKSQEAVDLTPLEAVTNQLAWTVRKMKTDGDINKWLASGVKPILLSGEKRVTALRGTYGGAKDLSAEVYLAADYDNLYVGVKITDDLPPAPNSVEIAFTQADVPLVVGWRDVGQRHFADDVHFAFRPQPDGSVRPMVYRSQDRMDSGALQLACGNETERRAQLDSGDGVQQKAGKVFAAAKDGFMDIAIPWRTLQPLDPVAGTPFKMNLAVYDRDGEAGKEERVIAFAPGIAGVFSGYHFPVFKMPVPPTGGTRSVASAAGGTRSVASAFAVSAFLPERNFLMKKVPFAISVRTAAPFAGSVVLTSADGGIVLTNACVKTLAGVPTKIVLKVDSEALPEGESKRFAVALVEGTTSVSSANAVASANVVAPTKDDGVTIFHKKSILALVDRLKNDADTYRKTIAELERRGIDTVYPRAWLAIMDMFVENALNDDIRTDPPRIIRNTKYLKEVICPKAFAYAERVLKDPSRQWIVPHGNPAKMTMKEGYFWNEQGKPEFFWGPCLFWYLRKNAHYTWELGFNSIVPEMPDTLKPQDELERQAYMKAMREHNVRMNSAVRVPDLQLTGADVRASKLLRENPDVKNLDQNNFMSFIVQHPAVKTAVDEGMKKSIAFNNRYEGINSFWLWNEPWYLNYSEMTRQGFIKKMKRMYGKVENLNKRWKTDYATFEDIQLIRWPDPNNYAPWYDFQCFRDDLLNDFFSMLHRTSRQYRPDMPTHVKFMSPSLASFDVERFQEPYEIIGRDGNASDRDNIYLDLFRSISPEKPIIDTEVHIWYGGDWVVNGVAWDLAMHGLADGNWWCWHSNPRFSDSIRNAQSMNALVMSGLDVRRLFADYIYPAAQEKSPYVTFFPTMCERRTDIKILRMRYEVSGANYSLGYRPFYATERTIGWKKALAGQKYLFAPETMYTTERTYAAVRDWVKNQGGTLIVPTNAFCSNEYGDARKTADLLPNAGGESYAENMTAYAVGKGRVITLDNIAMKPDPVDNGGQCLGAGGGDEMEARRQIYRKALAAFLKNEGLEKDVFLKQTGEDAAANALLRYDWRATPIGSGVWSVIIKPGDARHTIPVAVAAKKPIRRVVNMVDDEVVYEAPSKLNPLNWAAALPTEVVLPATDFTKVYRVELDDADAADTEVGPPGES